LLLGYEIYKGKLPILLNGFQKKTQKTPPNEIQLAEKLMKEYFEEQKNRFYEKEYKRKFNLIC
jgi:phage-related protein